MSQVNLFRIQEHCESAFIKYIEKEYETVSESVQKGFRFKLLWQESSGKQDVNWGWAFSLFKKPVGKMNKLPKGVMIVQRTDAIGRTYAISFGGAYFHIDAYCDRGFGFDFACRVTVLQTKLTSTVNNNSKRNKTISSFKNFDRLEINSGESYTKLKLAIDLDEQNNIANNIIEVGTSLKMTLKKDSFDNLVNLVEYVERILSRQKLTRIPVCNLVNKKEEVDVLDEGLRRSFQQKDSSVTISEFDIIGVEEVFVRADSYELLCGKKSKKVSSLNIEELRQFFSENEISNVESMLKTEIRFLVNGSSQVKKSIRNFIDYLDESQNALLICGKWYRFNDDFCQCLKDSLEGIRVVYDCKFDLTVAQIEQFWQNKFIEHKNDNRYLNLTEEDYHAAIRRRYYREYVFNLMREMDGYEVCDRKTVEIKGEKLEICDLRKDRTIYSVKRGNCSAELSYVVTQSEAVIDSYANNILPKADKPLTVVLWLILSRKDHLPIVNECLDWDMLNMFLLKIRIDNWKKKVQLAGMTPEIRVNYET